MRRFFDSLYGRLALVLVIALAAGFGTMYAVFRSHANDNRLRNLAHAMSVQTRLVEEVLRSHPDFDRHSIRGVVLAESAREAGGSEGEHHDFALRVKAPLDEELGRNSDLRPSAGPGGGFWIHLVDVPQGERWLYFPMPRHRPRLEPWNWGLWASFFVVLVGGMVLLWGVNKPLRRLERAIDLVGRVDSPVADTSGPREIRHLAEQFNRMVSRLKQYEQDRSEMLAAVAHDLRAPITRLRLQLELEDGPRRDAMVANLDGIEVILNQFLSFAQGVVSEPKEKCCLPALILEAVSPYLARGVMVNGDGKADIEMEVMPLLLQRALANLLENAIEYGAAPIEVAWERHSDAVAIRVSDRGPGIPAEKLEVAVKAFTRLDSARSGKGHCGLGLAIVDRIARLHGGRLALAAGDGGGLVAAIRLPLSAL